MLLQCYQVGVLDAGREESLLVWGEQVRHEVTCAVCVEVGRQLRERLRRWPDGTETGTRRIAEFIASVGFGVMGSFGRLAHCVEKIMLCTGKRPFQNCALMSLTLAVMRCLTQSGDGGPRIHKSERHRRVLSVGVCVIGIEYDNTHVAAKKYARTDLVAGQDNYHVSRYSGRPPYRHLADE